MYYVLMIRTMAKNLILLLTAYYFFPCQTVASLKQLDQ